MAKMMRILILCILYVSAAALFRHLPQQFDLAEEKKDPVMRENEINVEIEKFMKTLALKRNKINHSLLKFHGFSFKKFIQKLKDKATHEVLCLTCRFGVSLLQHVVNTGKSEKEIEKVAYYICSVFHIETKRVCHGISNLFKAEVTEVLSRVALDPNEFCGLILDDCGNVTNPLHNWTVPLTPFPKPPVVPIPLPKPGAPVTHVLHLSDTHFDAYYREGTNANCKEPLCCRIADDKPPTPADAAGKWGDYRGCDTPLRTLENMLQHINKTHKIDYVIWTGDIPPHDIWNSSQHEQLFLLNSVSKMLTRYFKGIPVFPALGNHESAPVNSFPIPQIKGKFSISWLYDELEKAWSSWLPAQVGPTLKRGAYYSILINPGFKIISLNMNYCNSLNWWVLINSTDPTGELEWLVKELQIAELNKEKVHIIGHIPPGGSDCLKVWSHNYYRIINRYESTVTAQFFGHTHMDEFEVFYDPDNINRPTNIAYIGPSVTTYDGVNPGYRIYTVDGNYKGSSRVVLDHTTYILNLTDANLTDKPIWFLEYSARKVYNMTSLLARDWNALINSFQSNDALFQQFYRYYLKMSDYLTDPCTDNCKIEMLCRLKTGRSHDASFCKNLNL